MLASQTSVKAAGLPKDSRWQDVQVASSGSRQTPIHGGPVELGIYNAIQSVPGPNGKREVVSGTSYLQVVSVDGKGPRADRKSKRLNSSPECAHRMQSPDY